MDMPGKSLRSRKKGLALITVSILARINAKVYVPLKKEMPSKRLGENPAVRVSSIFGVDALKGRALIAVFSLSGDVSRMGNTVGMGKETHKPCWEEPVLFARFRTRLELLGTCKIVKWCVLLMRVH